MVVNPAGYVPIYDFGSPKLVSGYARTAMSGGALVFISGAGDTVSSGANSFVPKADLLFTTVASGNLFNGIATQTAASGASVTVAVEGVAIITANGTVTCGQTVLCDGNDAVANGTTAGTVIGRALTTATSGGFALVHFRA